MGVLSAGYQQYKAFKNPTGDPMLDDMNVREGLQDLNELNKPYTETSLNEHGFTMRESAKGGYVTGKMQHGTPDNIEWKLWEGVDVGKIHTHPGGNLMPSMLDKGNMITTSEFPFWHADYIMTNEGIRGFYGNAGNWSIRTFTGRTFQNILQTDFWKYLSSF